MSQHWLKTVSLKKHTKNILIMMHGFGQINLNIYFFYIFKSNSCKFLFNLGAPYIMGSTNKF